MGYKLEKPEDKKDWQEKFSWEGLGVGGYSALDSALFGIPTAIVKAASSDAYKKLQKLREENTVMSTLGDIGGMLAPTGGLLASGVGKVAKAGAKALGGVGKIAKGIGAVGRGADTVADIIKTGGQLKGIGGATVRGGLTAVEQSLPRLLTGQQDLGDVAGNVALGGALGAGGKVLGESMKRLPEVMKKLSKWGSKTMLTAADVDSRILRQQAKYLGLSPEKAEKFVKESAKEVAEKQLYREPILDKYRADISNEWKTMAKGFDEVKAKIKPQTILQDNDVIDVVARLGQDGVKQVNTVIDKVNKTSNFAGKREYLNKMLFSDKVDDETKVIVSAVKKNLESTAEDLSGLDITKMKKEYPLKAVLEKADFRDELSTKGSGLFKGSDTAAKLALGGLGLGVGGATQIKGVVDDPTNPEAWGKLLTATIGGAATGALSKQIGFQLAKVAMKLDPDDVSQLIKKVSSGVGIEDLQKTISAIESKVSPILAKTDADILLPKLAGKQGEADVVETEATTSPEVQEEATQEVNEKYTYILKSIMKSDYENYFSDQMSYEDFESQVAELTDNFSPLKTAAIVFKDSKAREKYLTDYNVAMKLKETDVQDVMKKPSAIENIINPKNSAIQKKSYMDFIDSISTLVTSEDRLPSKATKDEIAADVKAIADLPDANSDEKRQLLFDKLSEKYGLDTNTLSQLGVI